jgi:hypothetical protein
MIRVTQEWAEAIIVAQALTLMAAVCFCIALLIWLRAMTHLQHRICARLDVELEHGWWPWGKK